MALIISLGSNLGNKTQNLNLALESLSKKYVLTAVSRIFESLAVDYINQPSFYNQILEFETPLEAPEEIMSSLLEIELDLGRKRDIPKGPRIIDIDILFIDLLKINSKNLEIPHPRLFERPFCTIPLKEIPYYTVLNDNHHFPDHLTGKNCFPIENRL